MALAAGLQLPLVLVIDTAGPALSADAEQGGLAGEIARCLAELVTLDTPTVSVLLGQGSGGPALAMVPADRVLAALHGWLAPLPPEGASAIVFRDVDHAPELAAVQGVELSLELLVLPLQPLNGFVGLLKLLVEFFELVFILAFQPVGLLITHPDPVRG